jgi:hypothetical protein
MDRHAVLAAFDEQIRRHPTPDAPGGHVGQDAGVIRCIGGADGWSGVTWSALENTDADTVIAAQISRFAELARPCEWKHYSYDRPQGEWSSTPARTSPASGAAAPSSHGAAAGCSARWSRTVPPWPPPEASATSRSTHHPTAGRFSSAWVSPSWPPRPRSCTRASLVRLEDHHRDLAVGLGLERVVGRPGRGHDAPQLGPLLGRGDPRPSGVVVGLDL